jgi:hypothetical protein
MFKSIIYHVSHSLCGYELRALKANLCHKNGMNRKYDVRNMTKKLVYTLPESSDDFIDIEILILISIYHIQRSMTLTHTREAHCGIGLEVGALDSRPGDPGSILSPAL